MRRRQREVASERELDGITATSDTRYLWPFDTYQASNVLCERYVWNSGRYAPVTIRLKLSEPVSRLTRMALHVEMYPQRGFVQHEIRVGPSPGAMRTASEFHGTSAHGDWIKVHMDESDVQFIEVTTHASPSFVAWRRIRLWGM